MDTLAPHLNLKPDYTVYLQCSPEACFNRIKTQNRPEEEEITLDYLKFLGESYDNFVKGGLEFSTHYPLQYLPREFGTLF